MSSQFAESARPSAHLKRVGCQAAQMLAAVSCLLAATPVYANVAVVENSRAATISLLDQSTYKKIKSVPIGKEPRHPMATPDYRSLIVASALRLDRIDIYRYDGKDLKLAKRLPLPTLPSHMAFSADSSTVFITQLGSDEVSAVDLTIQKLEWALPFRNLPAGRIEVKPQFGANAGERLVWSPQQYCSR